MESSTIQINNLDAKLTDDQLEEAFSDYGPLKRYFVVRPKKADAKITKGIVQFAMSDDVDKLFEETNGQIKTDNFEFNFERIPDEKQKSGGENVGGKSLEQRQFDRKEAHKKKARLIVRNLSFKATDDKLKSHFSTFGDVVDVNILKKKDGKMVGCAFIQYSNVKEASSAIKGLNGKNFLQRPVAIDWAVPKEQFQEKNPVKQEPEDQEDQEEPEKEEKSDLADENSEEKEEDSEEKEEDSDENSQHSEDNEDYSDDNEDDLEEDDEEEPASKRPRWEKGHDINENKTVFVRNLSFNSDEEDFRDMMEETFGKVLFARFVIDKETEHPKGTAFVKFADESSVEKCIEAAESKDGLWLDNRQIYAVLALKPDDAKKKQEEKKDFKKEKKDSRNLYLAREGIIREGTQAAIGVSKTDLELRVQLEKRKKQMLKDLNRFISSNRLCIRNLPINVTDAGLKKMIGKHVKSKIALTEVRVMKDLKTGKSKGFAFVAFKEHQMALDTLRALNNNPQVFTNDQRPIIEFSIENRKALNARQKRLEKSKEKNPNFNKENLALKKTKNIEEKQMSAEDEDADKPKYMGSKSKAGQTSLPTHTGPKIRHKGPKISRKDIKKREKLMKNPKKRQEIAANFQPEKTTEKTQEKANKKVKKPKTKAQIKDIRDDKKFNKMVSDYKQKLMGANSKAGGAKKRKWFDD